MVMKLVDLLTIASLLLVTTQGVDAASNEQQYEAVSLKKLGSFWVEAADIVADLESYEKLWIKPHSCVWTECAIDDTDDGYTGDNRDGDGQWYQYRTQGFCANAAYSLYGQKKKDGFLASFLGCTRRHFINSFFTYGGADNLLKSIGETPAVYNYDGDDNDGNANNDDGYGSSANAVCSEIEYDAGSDANNNEDEEEQSGSGDNNQFSGTLGCAPDGQYVIAAFQSSSCDGNYYAGVVDTFEEYNKQHDAIGCHKIYQDGDEMSVENVMKLLSNSWSCDLRLYPNGCPDPYGEKEKYDFAMRTVAKGGNSQRAYQNMILKRPFRITSWVMFAATVMIFIFTYLVKNESRAIKSKGGRNVLGYLRCVGEDIALSWNALTKKESTEDDQSSIGDKVSKDDASTDDSENSYVHVGDDVDTKARKKNGAEMHRSSSASARSPRSAKRDRNPELLKDEDMTRSGTWA